MPESSHQDVLDDESWRSLDAPSLAGWLKELALSDLRRALAVADVLSDDVGVGGRPQVLAARAHVMSYANRFDDAIAALERASETARREGGARDAGLVELAMVQPLARLGRLEGAELAARRALDLLAGDDEGTGKALLNLGIVLRMCGRAGESVEVFERARDGVRGSAMLVGALESNLAEALLDLDRFADAEHSFRLAASAFERAGNRHGAGIVEGNLADLLSRAGRLDEAVELFEHARQFLADAGAEGDASRLHAEQGEALGAMGAIDAALRAFGKAVPILERAALESESRRARFSLAMLLLDIGAHSLARDELERIGATEMSPVLGAQRNLALGVLALRHRQPFEPYVSPALEALRDRPIRLAQAMALLAGELLSAGRLSDGEAMLDAIDVPAEAPLSLRATLAHVRGRLFRARGDLDASCEELLRAMRLADRLRGTLRAERWRLAHGESWRGVYHDACSGVLDAGRELDLAFDAIERIRSRTLLEALGTGARRAVTAADKGLALEHQRVLDALNVTYARAWTGTADARPGSDSLDARRLAALEVEAETLRDRMSALGDRTLDVLEPITLDEARRSLARGAGAIVWFAEGTHAGAMLVDGDAAEVRRAIVPLASVERALRRLSFSLKGLAYDSGSPRAQDCKLWHEQIASLSEHMLEPLQDWIGRMESIAISPLGPLSDVPWGVLRVRGRHLIEGARVRVVPSLSMALRAALAPPGSSPSTGRRRAGVHLLAVGVPDELAPRMGEEASMVGALLPGSTVLVGKDATADRVLEAVALADIVHLATHVVHSPSHPLSSRLRLADRWVTARELRGALRPEASVVLAGCESGRDSGTNHDEPHGLSRALLASGAREVIGSLWPLHDRSASELFVTMHGLDEGLGNALRLAQLQAASAGLPEWLWAGLFAMGGRP